MTGALRPDGIAEGFSVRLALIINTADQPEYLQRVLRAVDVQTSLPEEVLLADDGSADDTREVFARWKPRPNLRREHVWQEKAGFRRARILNLAVAQAQS